jgi:hypothetical protein
MAVLARKCVAIYCIKYTKDNSNAAADAFFYDVKAMSPMPMQPMARDESQRAESSAGFRSPLAPGPAYHMSNDVSAKIVAALKRHGVEAAARDRRARRRRAVEPSTRTAVAELVIA